MNILAIYAQERGFGRSLFIDTLSKYSRLYTDTKLDVNNNMIDEYEITDDTDKEEILGELSISYIPNKLYLYDIYYSLVYRDDLEKVFKALEINESDLDIVGIDLLLSDSTKNFRGRVMKNNTKITKK